MTLDLYSEKYSPHGNMSAEGIRKSLGSPTFEKCRILVRETVQNSDDARFHDQPNNIPTCRFELRTLSEEQSDTLRNQVLVGTSKNDPQKKNFENSLQKPELRVLEISDWSTSGLGGPTRADLPNPGPEPTDFIDFIRNIGSPQDKELGGGTYGYGKSTLWLNSSCSTICLHTSTKFRGQRTERFMASRIGVPYETKDKRFTGRHWWGQMSNDILEPIEDEKSKKIANKIGLPIRELDNSSDMGTTLMIVDPDLGERSPEEYIAVIKETLLWFFWPKMIDTKGKIKMKFEVGLQGKIKEITNPQRFPPLNMFISSFKNYLDSNNSCKDIKYKNVALGKISTEKGFRKKREDLVINKDEDDEIFSKKSHHIALMRSWGGIVKYYTGPEILDESIEYGGVFVTEREVDDVFAKSEPPAHDDWIANSLEGKERGYVRTALDKIRRYLRDDVAPQEPIIGRSGTNNLSPLSSKLGGLLAGIEGSDTSVFNTGNNGPTGLNSSNPKLSSPKAVDFAKVGDRKCVIFEFYTQNRPTGNFLIKASPKIKMDDGGSLPVGLSQPEVIEWTSPSGEKHINESQIDYIYSDEPYTVTVSLPAECVISLSLSVLEK